jgi:translation initiation factor IF-2
LRPTTGQSPDTWVTASSSSGGDDGARSGGTRRGAGASTDATWVCASSPKGSGVAPRALHSGGVGAGRPGPGSGGGRGVSAGSGTARARPSGTGGAPPGGPVGAGSVGGRSRRRDRPGAGKVGAGTCVGAAGAVTGPVPGAGSGVRGTMCAMLSSPTSWNGTGSGSGVSSGELGR